MTYCEFCKSCLTMKNRILELDGGKITNSEKLIWKLSIEAFLLAVIIWCVIVPISFFGKNISSDVQVILNSMFIVSYIISGFSCIGIYYVGVSAFRQMRW